jgi:hypothetical protein
MLVLLLLLLLLPLTLVQAWVLSRLFPTVQLVYHAVPAPPPVVSTSCRQRFHRLVLRMWLGRKVVSFTSRLRWQPSMLLLLSAHATRRLQLRLHRPTVQCVSPSGVPAIQ